MINYQLEYYIERIIPKTYSAVARLWGIQDPIIGPLVALAFFFILYYFLFYFGLKLAYRAVVRHEEENRALKGIAIGLAGIMSFSLSGFAMLFANPIIAFGFLILLFLVYSRLSKALR